MELLEGKLYCENCGCEICMVPDFEPVIEESIFDTLSSISEDIFERDQNELKTDNTEFNTTELYPYEDMERPNVLNILFRMLKGNKIAYLSIVIVILLGIVIFSVINIINRKEHTFDQQYSQAVKYANEGDYDSAINTLNQAISMEPNNAKAMILLADFYLASGKGNDGIIIYLSLIDNEEVGLEACKNLIEYYIDTQQYETLNLFLTSNAPDNFQKEYVKYMANPPTFMLENGSYEVVMPLKITADTKGTIYYTIDGSTPTQYSQVYTAPIMLESGSYLISAIFENSYGVFSEVTSGSYYIDVLTPAAPEVYVEDGTYLEPVYIEVIVPQNGSVYYTMDGSMPTINSTQYIKPIPMPLGRSYYKFLSFNEDQVPGEVTIRSYILDMEANYTSDDAVLITLKGLLDDETLTDMAGNVADMSGRNVYYCSAAFQEDGATYYLVTEYYEDLTGSWYYTGNRYAVNILTGELFKTELNKDGYIHVLSFY